MTRILVALTLFTAGWVGVFAIGGWFRVPNVLFLAAAGAYFIGFVARRFRPWPRWFHREDFVLLLFFLVFIFSALLRPNGGSENYLVAYGFVFVGLYLGGKTIMSELKAPDLLLKANAWGILFAAGFVCADIILGRMTGIDLESMLPRIRTNTALYAGRVLRSYGLATEPGILAMYLNVLGPFAFYQVFMRAKLRVVSRIAYAAVVVTALLATFSAAGLGSLAGAFAIAYLLRLLRRRHNRTFITWISATIVLVPIAFLATQSLTLQGGSTSWASRIIDKITLSSGAASSRVERWNLGFEILGDLPLFGLGPGYLSNVLNLTVNSWYLHLIIEAGPIALFLILTFLAGVGLRMLRDPSPLGFFGLIGLIAGLTHLLVVSTFFHPFLWLMIAMFYALIRPQPQPAAMSPGVGFSNRMAIGPR